MTKKVTKNALFMIFMSMNACFGFHIDNLYSGKLGSGVGQAVASVHSFFSAASKQFINAQVITDPKALLGVIKDTLHYFHTHHTTAHLYPVSNDLAHDTVKKTLEFVMSTIEQDLPTGKFRILDPQFIHDNFKTLKWSADQEKARKVNLNFPNDGRIRLTNYAVFCVEGSTHKTSAYPYALYQLRDATLQKKYTKQQILAGVLNQAERCKKVKPLVWLNRDGLEDALMQGTIAVRLPSGRIEVLGLDRDNGVEYDKTLKNRNDQKRYWFFRRVSPGGIKSSEAAKKIAQRAQVVFAGDIANLGVGKLIAIKYPNPVTGKLSLRLGVLADTGSAFSNNLYQLDLFAGLFTSRQHFSQYMKTSPQFADAFILYR